MLLVQALTKSSGRVTLAFATSIRVSRSTPVSGSCVADSEFGQTNLDHLPSSISDFGLYSSILFISASNVAVNDLRNFEASSDVMIPSDLEVSSPSSQKAESDKVDSRQDVFHITRVPTCANESFRTLELTVSDVGVSGLTLGIRRFVKLQS